jgi:glycosyltransferase involved in cell wall biosynthesis
MSRPLSVHIVIPVYNEARVLPATVERVVTFLARECPYAWTLEIADNGSTDATPALLPDLARRDPRVRALRLERRGRGLALRHAWTAREADVHAYMEADLSTDLGALLPLLERIAEGYDIAVGSRHLPGAVVTRSFKREVLSRGYNRLLRAAFRTALTDAQCGFKAVSRRVVREVVPEVHSDGWFFDTELLLLAERRGYRIAEIPVRWIEDRDSRVRIPRTIAEYLRELWRLRRAWAGGPPGGEAPPGASRSLSQR